MVVGAERNKGMPSCPFGARVQPHSLTDRPAPEPRSWGVLEPQRPTERHGLDAVAAALALGLQPGISYSAVAQVNYAMAPVICWSWPAAPLKPQLECTRTRTRTCLWDCRGLGSHYPGLLGYTKSPDSRHRTSILLGCLAQWHWRDSDLAQQRDSHVAHAHL